MAAEELRWVLAPKEAVGDDHLRLLEWVAAEGTWVRVGAIVALGDTSKAAFEIESEHEGFLFHLVEPGERVPIGEPIAVLAPDNVRPSVGRAAPPGAGAGAASNITLKALALMQEHGIAASVFTGRAVVRRSDVEAYLRARGEGSPVRKRFFGDEELDLGSDWDAEARSSEVVALRSMLTSMRRRLRAKYDRHVPLGTLLHERTDVAKENRFGEATAVYDECLILGDVVLGASCWVGPFSVLDGSGGPLRIGDHTSIGTGSQVYTHHTIDRAITAGAAPIFRAPTTIGRACFISPMVMIGPGTDIGDHSFVAAGSYVDGTYPSHTFIAGNPARRVGRVEIRNNRVLLLRE